MTPKVTAFFDTATNTVSYIVQEPEGMGCAIIDSVLDYDAAAGRTAGAGTLRGAASRVRHLRPQHREAGFQDIFAPHPIPNRKELN